MAASSIRPMGTQRKQYLEAMIGLRIIVNPAVDQKLNREYKTGSSRSRQLEQQDENSMVEFATYPYLRDGEWLTIVQYNDENDLLIQPAMHLMNDAFFRHFMIDLVASNTVAGAFIQNYVKLCSSNNIQKQCVMDDYIAELFKRTMHDIPRARSSGRTKPTASTKVWIPDVNADDVTVDSFCKMNNCLSAKLPNGWRICLNRKYLETKICIGDNGLLDRPQGGKMSVDFSQNDAVWLLYRQQRKQLSLEPFYYTNSNALS
eukprot:289498_1